MRFGIAHKVAVALAGALAFAAAAAAQSPRTFTVHFNENDAKITGEENQAALGVAIEMAQDCGEVAHVKLTGHDDGPRAQEISFARVKAVQDRMVNDGGINASGFKTEARGKLEPRSPTPDRQNRRVEISISCS